MARKQFLINYHTNGATNPSVENVKLGEIVVKHNNEKPELVTLKNDGTFATFVDEKAIDTKLSAVTVDLTGKIEVVAGAVETLSGNVDTKFTHYATSAHTETAIGAAKDAAIAAASAYTDAQVASAVTVLTKDVEAVADDVEALSGAVDTKFADYATSADTETAIGAAKDAAIAAASAYTDSQIASAVTDLKKDAELAANGVEALSGNVVTLIGNDSGKTVRNIANEELAAQLLSGKADADFKTLQDLATWLENHPESVAEINTNIATLSAATGTLHTNIEKVAEDVEALSGAVDTKFANYATSADTETAIGAAKDAAIAAASAYTDAQVASAKTELNKAIEDVAKDVEALEKLSGATESAIQVIAVSGIEGVEVVESGTTRTIDFDGMIIDGGEY